MKTNNRLLHPIAWWIWAGSIAISIARSNSLLLSCATVGAVAIVVGQKAENAPWARSFQWSLYMGMWIVIIRVVIGIVVGVPSFGRVLVTLPTVGLPTWLAGIRIGGPVTWERLSSTVHEGLILASIIALLGAATSLSSPHRLLRSIPVMVYEFGVAVVIATSVLPQIVSSAGRIRQAQKLRGQSTRRIASWRRVALPLLEDSLARSLDLAAAMDSRGYGYSRRRSKYRPNNWTRNEYLLCASSFSALFFPPAALLAVAVALTVAPTQVRA